MNRCPLCGGYDLEEIATFKGMKYKGGIIRVTEHILQCYTCDAKMAFKEQSELDDYSVTQSRREYDRSH